MKIFRRTANGLHVFGRELAQAPSIDTRPDWEQADPAWIKRALTHSQALPTGGWYVLDGSRAIGATPRRFEVEGRALVVWRDAHGLLAAPEACPHLGASLANARVCEGKLICPWHGLPLGREGHKGWKPFATHDDGILSWVRLGRGDDEELTEEPILPVRPARALDAVMRVEAQCEPRDVIQNRLDPWHGVHFHPHSFGTLRVIDRADDAITVRVAYKLPLSLAVEVDARFHCPDARTIAMTIVAGEGEGSVVETHATPIGAGRTAVIEATLATSERPGFGAAIAAAPALRPIMAWAAKRLWTEDAEYAERLYAIRHAHTQTAHHQLSIGQPRFVAIRRKRGSGLTATG
jgi:phenylpropionate dioxygenase-like ring-hydroxylating dioxygenase large terminal subunit